MMSQHIFSSSPLLRQTIQHGFHEIFELFSFFPQVAVSELWGMYLAIMKSLMDHCCRLGTLLSLPVFEKYFLNLEHLRVNFLGKIPSSYIIWAMWSSFFPYTSLVSLLGLKRRSPVNISKVMQASDHRSAVILYLDPKITSGPLYCLV